MEVSPPPPLGGAVEGNNSLGGKDKEGEESENGPAGQCKHTHAHTYTHTHTLNLNTPKKTTLPPVDKGLEQHKLCGVFFSSLVCFGHLWCAKESKWVINRS